MVLSRGMLNSMTPSIFLRIETYPRPSSSGRTAGDGQLNGFIRRKDGLIKQQVPLNRVNKSIEK